MKEIWKTISNFDGLYSISNMGNVRREKSVTCGKKGNILKPFLNTWGYYQVSLFKDGKRIPGTIHCLVTSEFIGKKTKGITVNHKNGIKIDNRINNLEYATYSENIRHSYRTGLRKNKITFKQALEIRKKYKTGEFTQKDLSKEYKIAKPNISLIINNKKWKE